MKAILLPVTPVVLLTLINPFNVLASPVHKPTRKHGTKVVKTPAVQSELDAVVYLNKFGYNHCENPKGPLCYLDPKSMIKTFQTVYRLPVTGKLDPKTLKLMNTARCGVKDKPHSYLGPVSYQAMNPWLKKSFKWALVNDNLPAFGAAKTRQQIRESFNDWAKYAPLTFQEASENEKSDLNLAFIGRHHEGGSHFDGSFITLAYAQAPPIGIIRFNTAIQWMDTYNNVGYNFRLVATHEIGHALGLDHSDDNSSLMFPYYQMIQPKDLLPEDDRKGIQALYGSKLPSTTVRPPSTPKPSPPPTMKRPTEPERAIAKFGTPHGGSGGEPFDDAVDLSLPPMMPCIGVELFWWPDQLVAIRFIYGGSNSSTQKVYHGNPSMHTTLSNETFLLSNGERINKVTWYAGTHVRAGVNGFIRYVLGIQFHTNNGRISPLYGLKKGDELTESPEGFTLGYAKGKSGFLVDMLQFVWYNQVTVNVEEYQRFTASCIGLTRSLTLLILSAIYQSKSNPSACSKDVTKSVRKRCFEQASCSFNVNNEVFDHDPCHTALKELHVTYTCSDHRYVFGPVLVGRDSWGNDIPQNGRVDIENVGSIEACAQHCLSVRQCVGVVYCPDRRRCWLKHAMVALTPARENLKTMVVLNRDWYL